MDSDQGEQLGDTEESSVAIKEIILMKEYGQWRKEERIQHCFYQVDTKGGNDFVWSVLGIT